MHCMVAVHLDSPRYDDQDHARSMLQGLQAVIAGDVHPAYRRNDGKPPEQGYPQLQSL